MNKVDCNSLETKLNVDFLYLHYAEHCKDVKNHAMSEIHTIEMPMQNFNTFSCLTKECFYKALCRLNRELQDGAYDKRSYCILIVGLIDALTCMIKHCKFFEEFTCNVKHLLVVMVKCLQLLRSSICITHDSSTEQLGLLIGIVQRFIDRVKDHNQFDFHMRFNLNNIMDDLKLFRNLQQKREDANFDESNNKKLQNTPETSTDSSQSLLFSSDCLLIDFDEDFSPKQKKRKIDKEVVVSEKTRNNIDFVGHNLNNSPISKTCLSDLSNKSYSTKCLPFLIKQGSNSKMKIYVQNNLTGEKDEINDVLTRGCCCINNTQINNEKINYNPLQTKKVTDVFAHMMECSKNVFKKK